MNYSDKIEIYSHSVEQTIEFGKTLGSISMPGDVICIDGSLGAGKTHLVKGIATDLMISADQISSPTYALIDEHFNGTIALYHMDAYRINDVHELGPIGFDDYIQRRDGILVIEWSERILDALPDDRINISILAPADVTDSDQRIIVLTSFGYQGETRIASFRERLLKLTDRT